MIQYKAYNFRIYPNNKQQELLNKTFGCCRFVYNLLLDNKQNYYKQNGTTKGHKH